HFAGCDNPEISEQLQRGAFDALLVTGWHLKCYWQAIWAAKRRGIPVMVRGDSHLATPRGRLKRAGKAVVYPAALRVFDAALYVGEWSRRYWQHYGYPAHRLVFSPHCVDNAWFAARATEEAGARLRAAHGIEPNAKVVLFAGKLVPFKRVTDAALAAGILSGQQRPVTLMIAGSGASNLGPRRQRILGLRHTDHRFGRVRLCSGPGGGWRSGTDRTGRRHLDPGCGDARSPRSSACKGGHRRQDRPLQPCGRR